MHKQTIKNIKVLFGFLVSKIILAHLLELISKHLPGDPLSSIRYFDASESHVVFFITAVVIAPVIETYLVQYLIIESICKNFTAKYVMQISLILSAMIFGLFHWYNLFAIIAGFLMGLILSANYLYFRKVGKPFVYTVLLHSLYNLYAFILQKF